MPYIHGASRSLSDAKGVTPPASILSLASESRQVRLSLGASGQRPSWGGLSRPSWSRQSRPSRLSRPSTPARPSDGAQPIVAEDEPIEEDEAGPVPCWWAWMDSGMASSSLFFVGMVAYLWAVPLYYSEEEKDWKLMSWLYLVGATLFVVESLMDLAWGGKRWLAESALSKDKAKLASIQGSGQPRESENSNNAPLQPRESENSEGFSARDQCLPWLDKVHWDFWAALFFLIPSFISFYESFLDPYIVVWPVLNWTSMENWEFCEMIEKWSASIYIFDAAIALMGRYSYRRTTPVDDRLKMLYVWEAKSLFHLDWAAWGDFLFLFGAVVGLVDLYETEIVWFYYFTDVTWLVDALFYMIASFPILRSAMKKGGDTLL